MPVGRRSRLAVRVGAPRVSRVTDDESGHAPAESSGHDSPVDIGADEYERLVQTWYRPSRRRADFPRRRKARMVALLHLLRAFKIRDTYTEDEVNSKILDRSPFAMDHVQLRRFLVDYGMLERKKDGTGYRVGHTWMALVRLDPQLSLGPGDGETRT